MSKSFLALVAAAGLASAANAANTWQVDIAYSNPSGWIEQPGDSVTVTIWAQFDDGLYAFAGGALNVTTDDANGSWSNIGRDLMGPGTVDGVANGGSVDGIITGQLHFPLAGIFADTSNPIKAWHGTFTTTDFSYHIISLATDTSKFDVYTNKDGTSASFFDSLLEGVGGIKVGLEGPTPGTANLLVLGAIAAQRRRRGAVRR